MARYPSCPLPAPQATESYWMSQADDRLKDYNSADRLPTDADTVIIGSGVTGVLIAQELLSRAAATDSRRHDGLVMLEARAFCSGASGRNGGHIKPDCYKHFLEFQARYGTDEAVRLCRFEVDNMRATVAFIRGQRLADVCDLVKTRAVDFFMTPEAWAAARESIAAYREAVGEELPDIHLHEQPDLSREGFRFPGALGAVSYPACSLWPYKLVAGLANRAVDAGMQLFTHTPALSVTPAAPAADGSPRWRVDTPRGTICCANVFHATNGYVSHLLPGFSAKIVPLKGNVVALPPPRPYVDRTLGHTASIQWGEDFDYMIQREVDGKHLIFGGRDLAHPRGCTAPIGDWDDSTTTPDIVRSLTEFPETHMMGWTGAGPPCYAWSGIMGLTPDELPYVGAVPDCAGQWVAAGYSGHGMARAFMTVQALIQLFARGDVDLRVPAEYFKIAERLVRKDDEWDQILERNLEANPPPVV
ncbi:FAD dependent oxidoreductase [Colletotrichum graminicola]|uniref:FAD dependent oxidoreductase n=1 Tax=Colletotrichum graminicola (strain M1.001 / M2 / FGSC 10212) TaxID=645133 RepID=E3QFX5_COLGM|nr:FAD dependent oxidoreductase [Colletotrichum graminicola M1.001]EFQ29810.1 FAD dependent oxidoreductase [Colletotrichum graminicola M1.001]WDK12387.1 FAD dependent oxidoreductase [Colletotrichum graminicola]